ncbi:MAG: VWA domain-containing protein [Treponema sp.]|nr:VWA domain-containing protein [Treponema sp.]
MALTDKIEIPRRTMVLFFLIDTSGSMDGSKIGAVNTAIEEVIPAIREVSDENADAQIKIAALDFSSGATWITKNGPIEAEQFRWNYLDAAGCTDFGAACKALNEKLSTKAFMQEATGSFAPAIFLLSDGEPTDEYDSSLAELKKNNWFKAAVKVAIAIGEDANKDVLKEFTGSMEAVLEVHNASMLKKMIKFVSVTASKVASKSSNVTDAVEADDEQKQQELNANLQEFQEEVALSPDNDQSDW